MWTMEHPSALEGGCRMVLGREICSVPAERWQHGTAMFNDSTMLIYGGFSQRCEDYCDDLWSYDFRTRKELGGAPGGWMELIEIDDARYGRGETPGRRWTFSVVSDGETMFLFLRCPVVATRRRRQRRKKGAQGG